MLTKGKRIIKSYFIEKYSNEITKRVSTSLGLLAAEKYDEAADNDKHLLGYLTKIEHNIDRMHLRKELPLSELIWYIQALRSPTYYQRDSGVDNQSVLVFNRDFVENGVTTRLFNKKQLPQYVLALLICNLRLQRMDTYRFLYKNYVRTFSEPRKAQITRRLLTSFIGDVDLKQDVIPIIDNIHEGIEDFERRVEKAKTDKKQYEIKKEEAAYIADVLDIAEHVFMDVPDAESILRDQIRYFHGWKPSVLTRIIRHAVKRECCIDEIEAWYDTIAARGDKALNAPNTVLVRALLDELKTGELQSNEKWIEAMKIYEEDDRNLYVNRIMRERDLPVAKKRDICREEINNLRNRLDQEESNMMKSYFIGQLFEIMFKKRSMDFWVDFDCGLKKIESQESSDTVFLFVTDHNPVNGAFAFPLLMAAKKRGFCCIPSSPILFDFSSDDEELNSISGCRYYSQYTDYIDSFRNHREWTIDIPGKRIVSDSLNIFQPIYDVVSRWQFSCFYNFDTNAWSRARTADFIQIAEKGFWHCERLDEWAKKNNKDVKIVTTSTHVPLYAPYQIYCEAHQKDSRLNVICVRSGYDDYFLDSQSFTSTLSAINMTKNPYARTSIFGTKERFEEYYSRNKDSLDKMRKKAERWFSFQRSKNYDSDNEQDDKKRAAILKRIREHRKAGKKVYLMIGKLIFDMGVKYTQGCAHEDLSHWATHIVEIAKKNPDILLIIKPHPHETKKVITMTEESVVQFKDIIKTELPDNVIYLEGHLFRNFDLTSYIDVGLTWNSTSTLELAAMGIKVVMGDVWGYYDYPIGFPRLNSKEEFEDFYVHPEKYNGVEDLQDRAIAFLSFMGSEDLNLKNIYTTSTTSNYHCYESSIHLEAVDHYLAHGDERLEKMLDDIL